MAVKNQESGSLAAPAAHTHKRALRVLGTSVTLIEQLRKSAEADLGIKIDFTILDGTEAQRQGALAPDTFDVYDQWFHDIDLIWPTGSIRPIDTNRISVWDDIGDLSRIGSISARQAAQPGGDPSQRLFVQRDGSLSNDPTDRISMVPTVHNADSFGVVGQGEDMPSSWAALLDPERAGTIVLQSDAAIGCLDMVMALRATRDMKFTDIGNLTLSEIDQLTGHLKELSKKGQFKTVWADEVEAIEGFSAGSKAIGSLWWSGAVKLRAQGIPVKMATPAEGYRGWFGGIGLSRSVDDYTLELGYEYMNWWLSGPPGAVMARNGSYITNHKAVQPHLSAAEWDFWYEGKPAAVDIRDINGVIIYKAGEQRGGGSYHERMSRVAVWDAVMDEHNYLVRCWENALS